MKKIIRLGLLQAPVGPYSQAIICRGFVFVSGQFGAKKDGTLAGESIEAQTEMALLNLKAIAEAGGSSLVKAVKITVMLTDGSPTIFGRMNEVYAKYLDVDSPARSTFICGLVKPGALIEIDGIFEVGE